MSVPPHPPLADLARVRPDAVAIRLDKRCMYLEVTRPYDFRRDFAARSDRLKILRSQPMVDRFHAVPRGSGWSAVVIPLTIRIRGSVDEAAWPGHLASLA